MWRKPETLKWVKRVVCEKGKKIRIIKKTTIILQLIMITRDLLYEKDARDKLLLGVSKLNDAVKVTLGPNGRNVIIETLSGKSRSTKDGVSVAREVFLKHPVENIGAQIIKEVAKKTVEDVGDGTTTATLLAHAIFAAGMEAIKEGYNPVGLKKGIDIAVKEVVARLKRISVSIEGDLEKMTQIATISANGDTVLGNMIAAAVKKVGKTGQVTIEDSPTMETYVKMVEGLQFDRPYVSSEFINNKKGTACELDNPLILITNRKVSNLSEIEHFLNYAVNNHRSILIIADDTDGEALGTLIVNSKNGALQSCAIQCPGYRDNRKDLMQDIAIATNGLVISEEYGLTLKTSDPSSVLGNCKKAIINKEKTVLVFSEEEDMKTIREERIEVINNLLEEETDEFVKEGYKERIANLMGAVAVIFVGGTTTIESDEKKDRVDDALNATRAAIEEGVVPGGGVAYLRCFLPTGEEKKPVNKDELQGIFILTEALSAPLKQIMGNNGEIDIESMINKIISYESDFAGYNARSEQWEDFWETGVIDPLKVTRVALENAASISGLLLTTEVVISMETESKNQLIENIKANGRN